MTKTTINAQQAVPPEPELVRDVHEPKGVLRKNLKPFIYLGAALLVILAAVFSGTNKKTPLNRLRRGMNRRNPPCRTTQTTTYKTSRTSLQPSNRDRLSRPELPKTQRLPMQLRLNRLLSQNRTARSAKQFLVFPVSHAHSRTCTKASPRFHLRSKRLSNWQPRSEN